MVCDIFKKLGATCKAGVKSAKCPQLAKKKRAAKKRAGVDPKTLIGIDMPFDYEEVAAATGETYAGHMLSEGVVQVPYEELKQNVAAMLAAAEEQAAAGAKIHEFPSESVSRDILVVDDEVAVNNNIRKILAKKGFGVDQAFTKEEALASLESRAYTLVLLDLRIPGVKGLELLAAIREKRPATKVIMITGYASIETAVEAARMGVVEYLPKPFTPQEIRSATERAVQLAA
jgi:CheY-like chemotaxis protein